MTIAAKVRYLNQCFVVLGSSSSPSFLQPLLEYRLDDAHLVLLDSNEKGFVWDLFDKVSKKHFQKRCLESTSVRHEQYTCEKIRIENFFKSFKEKSKEGVVSFLQNEVHLLSIEVALKSYAIFREHLKRLPKRLHYSSGETSNEFSVGFDFFETRSEMDKFKIHVSKYQWAVALIGFGHAFGSKVSANEKKKQEGFSIKLYEGDHAGIVIEGVGDGSCEEKALGKHFVQVVHFLEHKGSSVIKTPYIEPYTLKYQERTKIWLKASWKVKNMLAEIEEEKKHPPKFSTFGSDSIITKLKGGGHSCYTWARKKLQTVDVNLGKDLFGFIATWTRDNTEYDMFGEVPAYKTDYFD